MILFGFGAITLHPTLKLYISNEKIRGKIKRKCMSVSHKSVKLKKDYFTQNDRVHYTVGINFLLKFNSDTKGLRRG